MAAATMVIAFTLRAAACQVRSSTEDSCSQAGRPWPAESLANTPSIAASLGSDRSRPASMR